MSNLRDYLKRSAKVIQSLADLEDAIAQAGDALTNSLENGGKLMACGNGGSANDASHLVTEFIIRYKNDRVPFAGITLNDSGGTLTAGSNDYGYDDVFARQIWGLGKKEDVLVVFTTSGNSQSIINAVNMAKEQGLTTIALLGKGGGKMKGLADIQIIIDSNITAHIQEAHGVIVHLLCEHIEAKINLSPTTDGIHVNVNKKP